MHTGEVELKADLFKLPIVNLAQWPYFEAQTVPLDDVIKLLRVVLAGYASGFFRSRARRSTSAAVAGSCAEMSIAKPSRNARTLAVTPFGTSGQSGIPAP